MQTPTSRQEPFIFEKLVNIKNKFLSIFVILLETLLWTIIYLKEISAKYFE